MQTKWSLIFVLLCLFFFKGFSQNSYELNSGWICKKASQVNENGELLSNPVYTLTSWIPATVPGTVLTTLLNNGMIPDPFYGMNNNHIPDIYYSGKNEYTYWFIKDFQENQPTGDRQIWLQLRGVNYSCEVYLNGVKLNKKVHYGMFLRQEYNITKNLASDGNNRLAVLVYPPDQVGEPNGGQGGDGTIARNVSHQYVAGWDWIQPIRDRNTGIWDKVFIEKSGCVKLRNPHIKTYVPGVRFPGEDQEPAIIKSSVEIENTLNKPVNGTLRLSLAGQSIEQKVALDAHSNNEIQIPKLILKNPKLWWPNGYGEQNLYSATIDFIDKKGTIINSDEQTIGIREIQTVCNDITQSIQIKVNGQKVFIKGGNWIISDAMLRFSPDRYNTEIRFHRDMNLNLIRIWGGAIIERPEFYDACDKYGLLVFQDFWFSGDCNGKWVDPLKKEDQWTRRQYPDDHQLFIKSAADQVKMVRNHASLAFWCGGNEITPPKDILDTFADSILPILDGTRYFFPYSNSNEMSYNTIGGNGDGPYTIQNINTFWDYQSYPFNSEVGSVGTGDYESLERFIPIKNMVVPDYENKIIDSVWDYHKDIGYADYVDKYGKPTNVSDFAEKAQLVNYDQYRALAEGFSAHMWQWYTGYIIWKTQNPWTALRGQMYDYYLDPNACLYGLRSGAEPVHVMCSPADGMVMAVNNTFYTQRDLMLEARFIGIDGKIKPITSLMVEIGPSLVQKYFSVQVPLSAFTKDQGGFLSLALRNQKGQIVSENLYWYADSTGNYSGLRNMPTSKLQITAIKIADGKVKVTLNNPVGEPMAFFSRISLVDSQTQKRVLPVFYSDNYISVMPGQSKTIYLEHLKLTDSGKYKVAVRGWNLKEQLIEITTK
jgi:mannosylglycoprotein endo-beta-mannosidase